MIILGVDIGGTHVKFRTQQQEQAVKVPSGPKMTPEVMMAAIRQLTSEWNYDHVTIGYPGPVVHQRPLVEPHNLGSGWVRFNFKKAFGNKPLRLLNDAAMQALGSYEGGRMLYLGLGTGLGSAMVVDGEVEAMELAHLNWRKGKTYEEFLGKAGLHHYGRKKWRKNVLKVTELMAHTLEVDYVVLGGGNAKLMKELPANVVLGSNDNAFKGAFMVWENAEKAARAPVVARPIVAARR